MNMDQINKKICELCIGLVVGSSCVGWVVKSHKLIQRYKLYCSGGQYYIQGENPINLQEIPVEHTGVSCRMKRQLERHTVGRGQRSPKEKTFECDGN